MSTLFLILLYILYLALDSVWIAFKCLILLIHNHKVIAPSIHNVLRTINNVLDKHLTRLESKLTATKRATATDPDINNSVPEPEDPSEIARKEQDIRQARLAKMKAELQAHVRTRRHEKHLNEARRLAEIAKYRAEVVRTQRLAYAARRRAEKKNDEPRARALRARTRDASRNAKSERRQMALIRKKAREARKKNGNSLASVSGGVPSDTGYVA